MVSQVDVNTLEEFFNYVLGQNRKHFHLYKIKPDYPKQGIPGIVGHSLDECRNWLNDAQARGWNLYFQLNDQGKDISRRGGRADIKWLLGFHADIDPPAHLDKPGITAQQLEDWQAKTIEKLNERGRPHIIMSGYGLQAIWPFAKRMKAEPALVDKVELINRRLAAYFGGDPKCIDVARLLRLPGTKNVPDDKKKKRGRKKAWAELTQVTDETFSLAWGLEFPEVKTKEIEQAEKIQYRNFDRVDYSPDYVPITYERFLEIAPDIEDLVWAKWDSEDPIRRQSNSESRWFFFNQCIADIARHFNCQANEFWDDDNIKKNIFDLSLESELPFLCRYETDSRGLGFLGYEIGKAISRAADKPVNTPKSRRKRRSAIERYEHADAPADSLTPLQHRTDFITHVRESFNTAMLPNAVFTANEVPCAKQNPTESNLRAILNAAGIVAKWDVMRDRAVYEVLPDVGRMSHGKDDESRTAERAAPLRNWQGAFVNTSADMLAPAQESLIADAMHEMGIAQREKLPKLIEIIAKEKRFHPIEPYARAVKWDGRDWIQDVANCIEGDSPQIDLYIRVFFRQCIAAVKSLQSFLSGGNGVQIGCVPILVGPQYIGKSTFWKLITPQGFLSASQGGLKLGTYKEEDSKRECLSGLVAPLDEIVATMSRLQDSRLHKNFFTATYDEFRTAYAHWPIAKPRMTVFVGTENDLVLRDPTGSRRYLPMKVRSFDFARLAEIPLQQCYAQAWHAVMIEGKQWWLTEKQDTRRANESREFEEVTEEGLQLDAYLARVPQDCGSEWVPIGALAEMLGLASGRLDSRRLKALQYALADRGLDFRDRLLIDGIQLRHAALIPITEEIFHRIMMPR